MFDLKFHVFRKVLRLKLEFLCASPRSPAAGLFPRSLRLSLRPTPQRSFLRLHHVLAAAFSIPGGHAYVTVTVMNVSFLLIPSLPLHS